jgi:hypothetical protein
VKPIVIAVTLLLGGCSSIFGDCEEDRQSVDVMYGSTYDLSLSFVRAYESRGYDCSSTSIRTGNGTEIGREYVCTKCD